MKAIPMSVRLFRLLVSTTILLQAAGYSSARPHLYKVGTTSPAAAGCDVTPPIPGVPNGAAVFKQTAAADRAADLQAAVNKLHSGDWLVLEPGTFPISKHISVGVDGVTLYGKGATLHSTNGTDGGLLVRAGNVAIYNLTLTQNSTVRQTTPWGGGISVYDDRTGAARLVDAPVIVGNTINNSAGTGIFLYRASRFTVADNTVFRSLADGIHVTGGSANGRIIANTVNQTGDDMIGLVSYAGNRQANTMAARYALVSTDSVNRNIYVAGNHLSDQYWGRGISVVGGSDVTIENNTVSRTPMAAGIYLLRESSYLTYGDHDILVRNNAISEVQTLPPTYSPPNYKLTLTRHAAIEIASQMEQDEWTNLLYRALLTDSGIEIAGNTIHDSRFGGIRLGANSPVSNTLSNVWVHDNDFTNVGQQSVALVDSGMDRASLACSKNKLDGTLWSSQCDNAQPAGANSTAQVPGAAVTCRPDGSIGQSGPRPPTDISIQRH